MGPRLSSQNTGPPSTPTLEAPDEKGENIEIPGVEGVGPVFSTVGWKSLERYFGKLGVLECYNVIILCEDAEVTE